MTLALRRVALVASATVLVVRPDLAAQVVAPFLLIALLGGFVLREARAWAKAGHETGAEHLDRTLIARASLAVFGPARRPHRVQFTADTAARGSTSRPVADD